MKTTFIPNDAQDELILSIAADPMPSFSLFKNDGKFFLFENKFEFGQYGGDLIPIGNPLGYDNALFCDLGPAEDMGNGSWYGYIALGTQSEWAIMNLSCNFPARIMAKGATFPKAEANLYEILGLRLNNRWKNLLTGRQLGIGSGLKSTPDRITKLAPGQIFVFGSNLQGQHLGGAARDAVEKFGAIWGQGVGLQGHSYAIPTMNLSVNQIETYVKGFLNFAEEHPEYEFLLTRIGCGIAGMKEDQFAPMLAYSTCTNVVLPESFQDAIHRYIQNENAGK